MKSMLVIFWLVVFVLLFLGASFWISDRTCVGSQTVTVGEAPVVNAVTCSG